MRHGPTLSLVFWLALGWAGASARGDDEPPLPDSRLGIRSAPLLLLSRPDVCDDLLLNPAQLASARQAIRSLYLNAYDLTTAANRGMATVAQLQKDRQVQQAATLREKTSGEFLAGQKAINQSMKVWIDTNLSPEQKTRLTQIDLQWEGPSALISRPVVVETLQLTADQRKTIQTAVDRYEAERKAGRPDVTHLSLTALACLTPQQQATWRSILGRQFLPQKPSRPAHTTANHSGR